MYVSWYQSEDIHKIKIVELEKSFRVQKRKQEGVEFPSAAKQEQLLIIRFNISQAIIEKGNLDAVRGGLNQLCTLLEEIDKGNIKFGMLLPNGNRKLVPLSEFNFSATLGFGKGFFEKLKPQIKSYPKNLKVMPSHLELGDSAPYDMLQTDFIIQLCSNNQDVNRRVFQNNTEKPNVTSIPSSSTSYTSNPGHKKTENKMSIPDEIFATICDWADILDMHVGFQRIDGTNLLGFNDGISNPRRLLNDVVWITAKDDAHKFIDGTYMVFQKIEHDLNLWRELNQDEQEQIIGRSKGTGLLLGTLSKEQDRKLAADLKSENRSIRERAQRLLKKLYEEQKDPSRKFYDNSQKRYKNIQIECPMWSHVRKANPRGSRGAEKRLIYRRGYLYMDLSGPGIFNSGLLFICFQKDIEKGFEYIKKVFLKNSQPLKDDLHNESFKSDFSSNVKKSDNSNTKYTAKEISSDIDYTRHKIRTLNRNDHTPTFNHKPLESLAKPIYSAGQIPGTITRGGGYYFIPPIPNKRISNISEQFFT